jgi:transketolase
MIDTLHDKKERELEEKANQMRMDVLEALAEAKSGHSGGSLGMADIFTALYFHVLKHDPKRPDWPERDRLVLSNGHICPIQYVAMAHAGYFPMSELKTLRKINSRLQGHPHRSSLPGLETTSGPLGSGLSQAIGMALAAQLDGKRSRIYCLTSDGEHQEGNHWEAVMFAAKQHLNNLTVIIDRNNVQIDGKTETIMPLEPLREKYESFNWHVVEVGGHNLRAVVDAINEAHAIHDQPTAIIAHTILGKDVPFMENDYRWHGAPPGKGPDDQVPREKQLEEALSALKKVREKIKKNHKI